MRRRRLLLFGLFLFCLKAFSQPSDSLTWWYPSENLFPVIEGQGWTKNQLKEPYDRLPAYGEKMVRKPVWNLSRNSTGEIIRFKTNAKKFVVEYTVKGRLELPHFAAMGFSGVDLYSVNKDGEWQWSPGKYKFGDTISFQYTITADDSDYKKGREYRLYLPIYNTIKWFKIGYPEGTVFTPLPVRTEKPIVVYGTSITQGGCASRAGMAWPSIVGRRLDEPFINLGFSGNGTLDTGMIRLVSEIDAKIYMLDCLGNLMNRDDYPMEEVKRRIMASVQFIHDKHPSVPIILPAFGAFNEHRLDKARGEDIAKINEAMKECYEKLKASGINNLYILMPEDMHMGLEATVDGNHPTDVGLTQYADANEKILRKVLNKQEGSISTTQPCIQYRYDGMYDWEAQHNEILKQNKLHPPKVVLIGSSQTNSIHLNLPDGSEVSKLNFYGDRIENILWRVEHGELDGFKASQIVLSLGTENLPINSDEEITKGVQFLLAAIKIKQPSASILVVGLPQRKGEEKRITRINAMIKNSIASKSYHFIEPAKLLGKDAANQIRPLLAKNLYANAKGYYLLTDFLKQTL